MTDSKGPYRVQKDDGWPWMTVGPCGRYVWPGDTLAIHAESLANAAHHTARREAIEACVRVVEDQRRLTLDNDYHAAMTVIIDRLRAAMEKEP